jgi:putative phosphoribosyl transferase
MELCMLRPFMNRREAGWILAERLRGHVPRSNVLVLALPRGGVPVAYEVATALDAPLDVFVVRKLGAPGNAEYAIGAIASGDIGIVDARTVAMLGLSRIDIDRLVHTERKELDRRERLYRRGRPFPDVAGKTVVLVDDGLATGSTMRAAIGAIRSRGPAAVIAAVPVASREACAMIATADDECVCAMTPTPFQGVGMWYVDFSQTTDNEVLELLARANARRLRLPRFDGLPDGAAVRQ